MLGGLHGLEMIQEEWRIFVIMETPFKDELKLKMGSLILHEVKIACARDDKVIKFPVFNCFQVLDKGHKYHELH